MLNRRSIVLLLSLSTLAGSGCSGMSKTAQGAGTGGALGAGFGALAGAGSGKSGKGALIGAAAGTLLGGIVGNDMDQQDKAVAADRLAAAESRPTQQALGVTDVQVLAAKGLSDDLIIAQLRSTRSTFQLSTSDVEWLHTNGVSDRVILAMKEMKPGVTRVIERQAPTQVIYREVPPPPPVIYAQPVYVVQPAPPPPGFGVGIRYQR